jgi:hypothetical protein
VDLEALGALRQRYTNPARKYLFRTVKVSVSRELSDLVGALQPAAHLKAGAQASPMQMHYLEFPGDAVHETAGLVQYDAAYRAWIMQPNRPSLSCDGTKVEPFSCRMELCSDFVFDKHCAKGASCEHIHVPVHTAQVRDPKIAAALKAISAMDASAVASTRAEIKPVDTSAFPARALGGIPLHPLPKHMTVTIGGANRVFPMGGAAMMQSPLVLMGSKPVFSLLGSPLSTRSFDRNAAAQSFSSNPLSSSTSRSASSGAHSRGSSDGITRYLHLPVLSFAMPHGGEAGCAWQEATQQHPAGPLMHGSHPMVSQYFYPLPEQHAPAIAVAAAEPLVPFSRVACGPAVDLAQPLFLEDRPTMWSLLAARHAEL